MNILNWYKNVTDETIREQLAENLHEDAAGVHVETLWEAIQVGFNWSQSDEGFDYWSNVCIRSFKLGKL